MDDNKDSRDHVYPQSVGGWYWVDFVCTKCNSDFGDHDLSKNPYVHAARQQLGFNPDFSYLKGQKIEWETVRGQRGRMGVTPSRTGLSSIPSKQPDGSIVSGDERARQDIAKSLRDQGWSEDFIQKNFFDLYDIAPDGIAIPIWGTGVSFIRHKHVPTTITYSDLNAPFRYALVAKIAVELFYTSGLAWEFAVDLSPSISAARENRPNDLAVARTHYPQETDPGELEYSPFHFASFGELNGHLIALVGFFGRFTFAICLGKILREMKGNWLTENWAFPIGRERLILGLTPPDGVLEKQYLLMVQALGDWFKKHGH